MKKLSVYMKRYLGLYVLGFASMAVSIVLDMMSPQITKRIIDDVITGGKTQLLGGLLLGLLGIGAGRGIFQYIKEFSYDYIGVSVGYHIRRDLFGHIQSMPMRFFDKHNTGELMTRVKDDTDKVWVAVGFIGILAVEAVTHTVLVLIFMFRLNPFLTLIPVVLLPLIGFCAFQMENRLGEIYDELSEETAKINTVAQECFAGVRTVKAFAREKYEIEKFSRHNHQFYSLNMKQAELVAKYQPLISLIGKTMLISVIVAGGLMVIGGRMTLGDLGAFSEYANNVIWPMEIVGWLSNDIASAFASWKKMKKVAAEQSEIADPEANEPLEQIHGDIRFEQVGFTLNGCEILHGIDFHLEPGKTLGIMGMTGAGKSTVVNLLQRFYDVTEGRILLDGRDIREIPLRQLRSSMAVVMQDVFLFSDSVAENVKTGRRAEISQDTVEWASERAGAARFIGKLAERYNTVIGERGVGLSGGQKQRISIARALAKRAPVLILDDATSALDMETEQMIQQNLREEKECGKIIIGHRISAVRNADEIIILDGNTIAERGTHEELMRQKGRYYETWRVQYEGGDEEWR